MIIGIIQDCPGTDGLGVTALIELGHDLLGFESEMERDLAWHRGNR